MPDKSQELKEDKSPELIYSATGEPFKSKQAAVAKITHQKLDERIYEPIRLRRSDDGAEEWAIMKHPRPVRDDPGEKYWAVIFNSKSRADDEDDVILTVNYETLIAQREVETIIPSKYREAADNATYPIFKQLPNQPRKDLGKVRVYNYRVVREATKEEYLAQKKSGTEKTREDMMKNVGYTMDEGF